MKLSEQDHKSLALWAAVCADHVLPYFEKNFPHDQRPSQALTVLKKWTKTGIFKMAVIRKASLDAHAAARHAPENSPARFAARAAGQAVATAHVPAHAIGAAWYGVKAADAAGITSERIWQYRHLPKLLRQFILQMAKKRPGLARVLQYPKSTKTS